jgi:hypothetical protein
MEKKFLSTHFYMYFYISRDGNLSNLKWIYSRLKNIRPHEWFKEILKNAIPFYFEWICKNFPAV